MRKKKTFLSHAKEMSGHQSQTWNPIHIGIEDMLVQRSRKING